MAPSNGKLTDEIRKMFTGKMNVEIAAMAANGEVSTDAAAQFLLERATAKAGRKGLITETATA